MAGPEGVSHYPALLVARGVDAGRTVRSSSQGMMIAGGVMMVLAGAGSLSVGESRPGPRFSNNKKDDMQLITGGRSPGAWRECNEEAAG